MNERTSLRVCQTTAPPEKTAHEKAYPRVVRFHACTSPEYPTASGCPLDAWSSKGALKDDLPKMHHTPHTPLLITKGFYPSHTKKP